MYLMDKPFSRGEKQHELDMLDGNITRICVSDDPEEIVRSLGFAIDRLSVLAYSRMKEVLGRSE